MARLTVYIFALAMVGVTAAIPAGAQGVQTKEERPPAPEGVEPLPEDMFLSENFYFDKKYWTDPRYFRCNTPDQITHMIRRDRYGEWGDCDHDAPVEELVSPYNYETAEEHYNALLEKARENGGPTEHTRETLPRWGGWYARTNQDEQWVNGENVQTSTLVSLLTPEYQERLVQMAYHESVNNSHQWSAAFCWPEGTMRWWYQYAVWDIEVLMHPQQVQFLASVANNFIRKIHIGEDREHVQKVPQWYGESIGFWDGDKLIVWTANVQGWQMSHTLPEFSNDLEIIEVIQPQEDGDGLIVEATFYDPNAFKEPLYNVSPWERQAGLDSEMRYTFVECSTMSQIVNDDTGHPTQLLPGDDGYIDYFNRPWAENWEEHFEKGWEKPGE